MSASTAPQREPIEADRFAEEPRRETGGNGAPIELAAFAQMDASRRLAYLRGLLAEAGAASSPAADDWRRRNAPDAPNAEPAPIFKSPAPAAPVKKKTASSTPRRVVKTLLGLALVAAVGYEPLQRMAQTSSVEAIVNARVITLRAPIEGEVQPGPAARESAPRWRRAICCSASSTSAPIAAASTTCRASSRRRATSGRGWRRGWRARAPCSLI